MVTFDSCRLITGHYTQTFSSHDNAATNPPGYGDARRRAFEYIRDWEAQRGIDVTTGRFQSIWGSSCQMMDSETRRMSHIPSKSTKVGPLYHCWSGLPTAGGLDKLIPSIAATGTNFVLLG